MEQREFSGKWAEPDLITYVARAEAPHVGRGGGLVVCGGSGGLRDWIAAGLGSATGGALVGELVYVQADRARAARESGLGVVLFTALGPASVVDLFLDAEATSQGWGSLAGLVNFGGVVQRFVHAAWDPVGKKFVLTCGDLGEARSLVSDDLVFCTLKN